MEDRSGFFFRVGKDDGLMHEVMDYFQQQGRGKLSRALRDGLRLFWDLSHQRTDVLIELFPFVKDSICPPTTNNDEVLRELEDFRREFRERQNTQTHDIPDTRSYGIPAMKQSGSGIGKLAAHTVAMPTFDDDDAGDTIVLNHRSDGMNGTNLLSGMLNITA